MAPTRRLFLSGVGAALVLPARLRNAEAAASVAGAARTAVPAAALAVLPVIGWHGKTLTEHVTLRNDAVAKGYQFLTLTLYGTASAPLYAATMAQSSAAGRQRDWPQLAAAEFQDVFDTEAKAGYGPLLIAATGTASNPLFAAVYGPAAAPPLTRVDLRSGAASDPNTLQGVIQQARIAGLIPASVASYGTAADPRFAAVFAANPSGTAWNADGLIDSSDQYQARFDAQGTGWCRPIALALNGEQRVFSVFADDQLADWVAHHDLSEADYQSEFDSRVAQGYAPVAVQAGGANAAGARFAVVFAKSSTPVAKAWTATGPLTNDRIDRVIQQFMMQQPVRQASLAIVHGSKLVYARGYTYAEPGWPITQPTTLFRLASMSKSVAALALFQLIEEGALHPTDRLQDILKLATPAGKAPSDKRFATITVAQLLEHTSGLDPQEFNDDIAVRDAHKAADPGQTFNLPVSAAMVDAYVASRPLVSDPGKKQVYNNCGYYLLGRVLTNLRGTATPIEAIQSHLLDPLKLTRVRRGRTLVADQAADEARYGASATSDGKDGRLDVPTYPSVMSNDRPLTPRGYGQEQYENKEGSGGLSAAATDIARLLTVWMSPNDTPVLKRQTVKAMLDNAVATVGRLKVRAGYGLDDARHLSGESYYGQKGGELVTSQNVLQFSGDWGFVLNWASHLRMPAANWYPDFPAVMTIAKAADWGSDDLFPGFGIPAL